MDRSYQPVRLGSTDQMQVSGFLCDGSGHPACLPAGVPEGCRYHVGASVVLGYLRHH